MISGQAGLNCCCRAADEHDVPGEPDDVWLCWSCAVRTERPYAHPGSAACPDCARRLCPSCLPEPPRQHFAEQLPVLEWICILTLSPRPHAPTCPPHFTCCTVEAASVPYGQLLNTCGPTATWGHDALLPAAGRSRRRLAMNCWWRQTTQPPCSTRLRRDPACAPCRALLCRDLASFSRFARTWQRWLRCRLPHLKAR